MNDKLAARLEKSLVEVRGFPAEVHFAGAPRGPVLMGHAAIFNQLSDDLGGFRETIAPGAFSEAIKGDVRALWNHNNDRLLGRTKSGTLRLAEDETGLAFRINAPDTSWFRDSMVTLRRGDVTGASFGWVTGDDRWTTDASGRKIRTILKVRELVEVSPGVTFPAYPQSVTELARRSLRRWLTGHLAEEEAITGYAAVFDEPSRDLGGYRETFIPGAFTDAIRGDVRCLWAHRGDLVLGRTGDGSLALVPDALGLAFRVRVPRTSWSAKLLERLRSGGASRASFEFRVAEDEWTRDRRGQRLRRIRLVGEIAEVSPGMEHPDWLGTRTELVRGSLFSWLDARPGAPRRERLLVHELRTLGSQDAGELIQPGADAAG